MTLLIDDADSYQGGNLDLQLTPFLKAFLTSTKFLHIVEVIGQLYVLEVGNIRCHTDRWIQKDFHKDHLVPLGSHRTIVDFNGL